MDIIYDFVLIGLGVLKENKVDGERRGRERIVVRTDEVFLRGRE